MSKLNERQSMRNKTAKDDAKVLLVLINKRVQDKIWKYSCHTKCHTRQYFVCRITLQLRPIEVKFLPFYLLVLVKYRWKYRGQKTYLLYKKEKIVLICHTRFFEKISDEILMCLTILYQRFKWINTILLDFMFKGLSRLMGTDCVLFFSPSRICRKKWLYTLYTCPLFYNFNSV
jgi:hypothetical protein